MARVERLGAMEGARLRAHPTSVRCAWAEVDTAQGPLLQVSTYGSDERAEPGTVSQTLQLDREVALALKQVIEEVFGG